MSTHAAEDRTDKNVTRVIDTVRANRGVTVKALIIKSGIPKSTWNRRRSAGGWTASELVAIAGALNCSPAMFLKDAAKLLPGAGDDGLPPTTDCKSRGSRVRFQVPQQRSAALAYA